MWLIPFAPFSFAPFFALLFESPAAPSPALRPAEARVSILLYDALDFSTDRDDGGGQTRESLSRVASASAAVTGLDPARTETVSRFVIILSLAVFGRVKAEGFAPDVPIKFARIGSV